MMMMKMLLKILLEQANVALFRNIVIDEELSTFDEAWNHEDLKVKGKWRDAIKKELDDMDKQQVGSS
jgi:ABC-type Fe3+/spermidine/putrescine transport system ATPase subunit